MIYGLKCLAIFVAYNVVGLIAIGLCIGALACALTLLDAIVP
jgi:hypothetical protein